MFRFPGSSSGATPSNGGAKSAQKKGQKEGNKSSTPTGKTKKKNDEFADLPDRVRRLRACMICSLIKSEAQFEEDGCDNCESFLQLAKTKGSVTSYTSGNFEGMIGMMDPKDSWVAKWQRTVTMKPGMYAVNVRGKVERWVKSEMEDAGITYYCRDKTEQNNSKPDKDKPRKRRTRRQSVENIADEDNALALDSGNANETSAGMTRLSIDDDEENSRQVQEIEIDDE